MSAGADDAAVAAAIALAESQHGVVSAAQLAACGLSERQVRRLVRVGWLRRVRRGAYAIAGRPASPWEQAMAAALVAGPGAALSHWTAAAVHGLPLSLPDDAPELTVVQPSRPRLAGVIVHTVERLPEDDLVTRRGVRITSPARTLVDLSPRLSPSTLGRVVDEGCLGSLWTVERLGSTLCRIRGGPGRGGALRAVLAERSDDHHADSMLEFGVIRALEPLAPFETQYQLVLEDRLVILDIAWPAWRVGVEADGWHPRRASRGKFDGDRRKSNLLAAHGWTIIHVTSAMTPDEILGAVLAVLPTRAVTGLLVSNR